MLVLTRKKSQLIQIGDNIVIKVIRTGPGSVKLGIEAPNDVRVMRGELDDNLVREYKVSGNTESAVSCSKVELEDEAGEESGPIRRSELVEEEEPVSYSSRKSCRASVV